MSTLIEGPWRNGCIEIELCWVTNNYACFAITAVETHHETHDLSLSLRQCDMVATLHARSTKLLVQGGEGLGTESLAVFH
jgi:hypothetical protein